MAKDPAFLFYPGDWMGGTATFSRFLKGCYMDVLIAQFNSGHLSLEEIKTVLGSDFGAAWPTISKKFEQDRKGLFFNVKLETEKEKRKAFTASRGANRKGKGNTISTSYEKDMNPLMESENVNRDLDESKGGEGGMNLGLEENLQEIKNSFTIADSYMKNYGYSKPQWDEILELFCKNCREKESEDSLTELKIYLSNWHRVYKEQKKKKTSKNEYREQNTSDLTAINAAANNHLAGNNQG